MLMFNMSENSSLSCSKNRTLHYTWIKLNKICTYKQDYRLVMCSLLTLIYLLFIIYNVQAIRFPKFFLLLH